MVSRLVNVAFLVIAAYMFLDASIDGGLVLTGMYAYKLAAVACLITAGFLVGRMSN